MNKATRVSATEIILEWNALSDNDLRGFFMNYHIKYYTTAVRNDCSSPMDEKTLTTTDEHALLGALDTHSAYCVKVAVATNAGPSNYTSLIYVDSKSTILIVLLMHILLMFSLCSV